jgi:hypothetical protein
MLVDKTNVASTVTVLVALYESLNRSFLFFCNVGLTDTH